MDNNQDYQQQPDYQQPVEQPVEQPQYQEPQYQQPEQQPVEQPQYQQPYQQQPDQPESFMQNPVVSLVLAIINIFSCPCYGLSGIPTFLIGLVALVLAILAIVNKNSGEIQKSRDFAKYSIITSIVGIVLGIIITIVIFVIFGGSLLSSGAFNDMF